MKNNTKIGFNSSFLAAIIFISGISSPLLMFGLIIYVLLFENDRYLKDAAKKSVAIYGIFAFISGAWIAIDDAIRVFMNELGNYSNVYNKVSRIISLLETICFIVMAFRTYTSQELSSGTNQMDKVLDKVSTANVVIASETDANTSEQFVYCAHCGNKMLKEDVFCNHCGMKKE